MLHMKSNRVSDFRDFVYSLFPMAIFFTFFTESSKTLHRVCERTIEGHAHANWIRFGVPKADLDFLEKSILSW